MAFRITGPSRIFGNPPVDIQADSEADIANLPTQTKSVKGIGTVPAGSTCLVIGDGGSSGASLYGLNSKGVWVKM